MWPCRRNGVVKCGRSRFRSRFPFLLLQTSSLHHHTRYQLLLLGSILQDCNLFFSHSSWCFYFIAYFIFIFSLKNEKLVQYSNIQFGRNKKKSFQIYKHGWRSQIVVCLFFHFFFVASFLFPYRVSYRELSVSSHPYTLLLFSDYYSGLGVFCGVFKIILELWNEDDGSLSLHFR